ncbi:monofunctional biosynthetic peptidoglycan transglycosylase [Blastococcus sp. DSM 46786]|uniref:transglycosylase domain-containing protein n=1 Tax=Blastococcus sp. DSM 46786 TaxID=1798227 RepID=UPI0008AD8D08|nr:transglycosylase domain-containing protein [Blastococcus sp. DSM 46786]SEL61665.1 monofunctional biosynthetic peptidoglycan transglycosylase [Blastococcus sp. DSM 46786]
MASVPPDSRSTRWLRRRPTEPLPQQEPARRPRFDQPPPQGNDWYAGPPSAGGPPPPRTWPGEAPQAPWPSAPPGGSYPPPQGPFPPPQGSLPPPRGPFPPPPRGPFPPSARPAPPAGPERGRRRRLRAPRRRRGLVRRIVRVLAVLGVVQALVVLSLRWVDPPTTAFMAANPEGSIQQSVPVEHVSRNFLAAVIAHEDAQLPYRDGAFEWDALWARATAHLSGAEDPSGSTIPQQVAKNLFLNQELSAWRKGLEAALSAELAAFVDDRRMLELYVNYAQFGPTIYGVCAAGWYYFDSPPAELSAEEAVMLVGLLPSPGHVQRAPGGGMDFEVEDGMGWLSRSHVLNAQARVPRHLDRLGFTPVEDAGVEGLASEQEPSGDDCSTPPQEVTDLITSEGTA